MFKKIVAVLALSTAVMISGPVAHAQDTCDTPYCSPETPDNGNVLPAEASQGGGAGADTGAPGSADTGAPASAEAPAATTAPSGSLPFTGGDVVGMVIIGAGAVALGSVLVLRSKRSSKAAA